MISYANAYVLFPLLEHYSKRVIQSKLKELRRYDSLVLEQQNDIQKRQCYLILQHCQKNVPYYTELFEKLRFNTEDILKDIKYIHDLPILTKDIVRENSQRLRAPDAHHVRKTGGSTGQSVFFYYDNVGLDWTSAMHLWAYEMVGKKPHHKDCHISADLEILGLRPNTFKGKFLDSLKMFSQNRQRLMVSSFTDSDLEKSYLQLRTQSPYLLQGHPSTAYAIAGFMEKSKKPKLKIQLFEPSGEMFTEKMVTKIEEVIGCKVVNRYGNAECGVMAHSKKGDNYNRLKIFNRAFYMEDCEKGSLIVSNFTNYGFPLLRYDTGDIGTVKKELDGTYLYNIEGRIHDRVEIAGKEYPTHFIMDCLDHKVRGVREFQIILNDNALPTLNIVAEDDRDQVRITNEIQKVWPKGLIIEFITFDDLQRVGWRQKFRHVMDNRRVVER